ncbi:MAG: ParB/RepB/Spo0J family partition protein [Alistipes sp.]|nr:ParB/RepB/Spo0J family partition protein [Paludibacteraceae bacterium]MBO5831880.1 ParB/RepB/Spo0J family partition protein [Alistipes sp.]
MTAQKKRGLGRGLDALFGPTNPTQQSTPMSEMAEVAISDIIPNPLQPRRDFDDETLQELATSIAELGVIQPITLKRQAGGKYIIISGERRWRASQIAGLETLPAYIRDVDDEDLHAMALVENIQRENLNAIEIALGMQRLVEECGLTQEAMAQKVGKKRSTVSNYMRLLSLPSEVQLALKEGIISMGHAKAIAGLDHALQVKALKKCVKRSLSVRQAEELARKLVDTPKGVAAEDEDYPESYSRLVVEMERVLSDNISIKRTKSGTTRITLECASDAEVELLVAKLSNIK